MLAGVPAAPAPSESTAAPPFAVSAPIAAPAPRGVQALRAEEPITIDGALGEAVWRAGDPFTALIQRDPVERAEPSQRTEVRIAYDDYALYVGARMLDTAPDSIAARLARRDAAIASDRFG